MILAIGDTHGHLQLALAVAARWQTELGAEFEAVLLCGDVGSFTSDVQLDSTTRRHAKTNPCELEFLHHWSAVPQPEWLGLLFRSVSEGGMGLTCPVIMVHGNHEGFAHLAMLVPDNSPPVGAVVPGQVPAVDTGGHIRYLPSGWVVQLPSGLRIAGIGGIERGQRFAEYPELAYIEESAVLSLTRGDRIDVLLTHQGPARVQGAHGSPTLDILLEEGRPAVWFHSHSIPHPDIVRTGPEGLTTVVSLGDIGFGAHGVPWGEPGKLGWGLATIDGDRVTVQREAPAFLREFHLGRWSVDPNGLLVCPPLVERLDWKARARLRRYAG